MENSELMVRFNDHAGSEPCAACGEEMEVPVGPVMVLQPGNRPICTQHADGTELWDMFRAARDGYLEHARPEHRYFMSLREALAAFPRGSCRLLPNWVAEPVDYFMEEMADELDTPVVRLGGTLYRAENLPRGSAPPWIKQTRKDLEDRTLASVLQRIPKRTVWIDMAGVKWRAGELLDALTTRQLAFTVTKNAAQIEENGSMRGYAFIEVYDRHRRVGTDIRLFALPDRGQHVQAALCAVHPLGSAAPEVRRAGWADSPFWPADLNASAEIVTDNNEGGTE